MSRPRGRVRHRRLVFAAAIVAAHLALLAVAVRLRPPTRPPRDAVALETFAVAAPPPPQPPPPRDAPVDAAIAPPAFEIAAATPAASGCDILATVGGAARADTATVTALAKVAATPSPALMAWNGRWSDAPAAAPLHRAVAAALQAATTACLDEPLTGPRLIFVPAGGTTVTIAFGSGRWRWRDTLSSG